MGGPDVLEHDVPATAALSDLNLGATGAPRYPPHEHHKPRLPTPGCVTHDYRRPLTSTDTRAIRPHPSSGTSRVYSLFRLDGVSEEAGFRHLA